MSQFNLDIVKIVDAFPCTAEYPADWLEKVNYYFHFRIAAYLNTLTLVGGDTEPARTAILEKTTLAMRATGHFKLLEKWRDELYPVYGPSKELLFSLERSDSPLFGVVVYGINMTAFHSVGTTITTRKA